jgi:hypothetical protein
MSANPSRPTQLSPAQKEAKRVFDADKARNNSQIAAFQREKREAAEALAKRQAFENEKRVSEQAMAQRNAPQYGGPAITAEAANERWRAMTRSSAGSARTSPRNSPSPNTRALIASNPAYAALIADARASDIRDQRERSQSAGSRSRNSSPRR